MKPKTLRWVKGLGLALLLAVAVGAYGVFDLVRSLTPTQRMACADSRGGVVEWACGKFVEHLDLSAAEVAELNTTAGPVYPIYMADSTRAENTLKRLLQQGVSVDARDERVEGQPTALHVLVLGGEPQHVAMLLRQKARVDLRDSGGTTPVELARQLAEKHPSEPGRAEIVRLLNMAPQAHNAH